MPTASPTREGTSVSNLAKLPEEELSAAVELEAADLPPEAAKDGPPHILNDGVGEAEASDHIDDLDADGEPDA